MDALKENDKRCEDIQKIKDDLLTEVFNKYGTFFAFSDAQFKEQREEGVEYVSLGSGMITPKATAGEMLKDMDKAIDNAIAKDKELNSKEAIILRELLNYECFYTGSPRDAIEALKDYDYTKEEVLEVFRANFNRVVEELNQ